MQIYHYDDQGIFIDESTAELDPLEGKPLIPGNATPDIPPALIGGKVRVYAGGAWSNITDNRGVWYMPDRTEITLKLISDLVPIGAARDMPPKTLEQLCSEKITSLTKSYLTELQAPITYMLASFQADIASQSLIAQVVTASGGTLPADFGWYDMNNVKIAMTFTQLQGLANAILLRAQPLYRKFQEKKKAARDAINTTELGLVSW